MAVSLKGTLGERARGTFGKGAVVPPEARSLVLGGEFLRPTTQRLPGTCGDERLDIHGTRLFVPAAFGGFAALPFADALTTRLWYEPGMTFEDHVRAMYPELHERFPQAKLGLHTDENALQAAEAATDEPCECGCAAITKAPAVVSLLLEYSDVIDEAYREEVVANAKQLLQSGYFQPGTAEVLDDLHEAGLALEVLAGPHNGVFFAVVEQDGMILDRPALYKAALDRGIPVPYVFEYDRWVLRSAAHDLTDSPDAAKLFFAGGDALNMVTMLAIGASDMPVGIVQ